jgi:hypothetical protein
MSGIVDWEAGPAGRAADDHDGDGARSAAMTVAHAVARAFASAVESGRLDLPHPGSGRTRERWAVLADLAGEDLCLARLAEGHADALAVLAELGAADPAAGRRWGMWAAQPAAPGLTARRDRGGWRLDGVKQYCCGARSCTDALVTARAPDGERLFVVSTRDLWPVPGTWRATGMAASDTLDVSFDNIAAEPVGAPGSYTSRPGFAHGGAGVAACWYGGARAVGRALWDAAVRRDVGPHALAHLGAVDLALHTAKTALDAAAAEIDADPHDQEGVGPRRALRVRGLVEACATDVVRRVGQALGAGPLCRNEAHSRRVADLTVYLRQYLAERDLAQLGTLVAGRSLAW